MLLKPGNSVFSPNIDLNDLLEWTARSGSWVTNLYPSGSRLNVVYDYGTLTGSANINGVVQTTTGIRIAIPLHENIHWFPANVPGPDDSAAFAVLVPPK